MDAELETIRKEIHWSVNELEVNLHLKFKQDHTSVVFKVLTPVNDRDCSVPPISSLPIKIIFKFAFLKTG